MKTLLYVEDEPNDVLLAQLACKRAGIASVFLVARDGGEAIAYLSGSGSFSDRSVYPLPSLVLLDLKLPVKPGLEVLAWIRGQPEFQTLPVVIFSSSGAESDREKAKALGASGYVVKPTGFAAVVQVFTELKKTWSRE